MKNIFKIDHLDPRKTDYVSYNDHLEAFNKGVQQKLGDHLSDILNDMPADFSVETVGSDARLEKGPVSPIELMIVKQKNTNVPGILKRIENHFRWGDGWELFDEDIEIKDLNEGRMSYVVMRKKRGEDVCVVSPNRMLDSWMLYGNPEIHEEAIEKLKKELKSGDLGKPVIKRIMGGLKSHKKVTGTGIQRYKQQDVKHFDLEEGLAFYDPDKNKWSFKQGPLRLAQYAFVRDKIRLIRGDCPLVDKILNVSKNTVDALHELSVMDNLAISPETASELADHYKFFLWNYHVAQQNYKDGRVKVSYFHPGEAKKRAESLIKICSEPLISSK